MATMPMRIMSDAELNKFEILRDVDHERMPVRAAAQVLGLSERQVWRLLKAYRLRGADGLISRKRGRPSNHKTPDDVRLSAMALVKARYADFEPTLAAEKLGELHDLHISRETPRAWMVADGLWQTRKKPSRPGLSAALPARLPRRAGADRPAGASGGVQAIWAIFAAADNDYWRKARRDLVFLTPRGAALRCCDARA